jgi:Ca2+-binding RTX toxin-like protein
LIEKLEFANQETLDISNKNNLSIFDSYINDNDNANNINGSSNKDYILGNKGGDHIEGGQGSDEIHGGDGDDAIYGNKTLSFNYVQSGLYGYTPDENNSTQLVGDFNGDGKDDIVNLQSDGWSNNWVALSNGVGGFAFVDIEDCTQIEEDLLI